jgi:hypothetical protein
MPAKNGPETTIKDSTFNNQQSRSVLRIRDPDPTFFSQDLGSYNKGVKIKPTFYLVSYGFRSKSQDKSARVLKML